MPKILKPTNSKGALLRSVRKRLGLNQKDMAERMGCDPVTLSRWETGAAEMPAHRLDRLLLLILDEEASTPRLLEKIRAERQR